MGHSTGRCEGDSLVVDVAFFNGRAWLDRAGNHTTVNQKVTERFTPITADAIMYEATIQNPDLYTRPWTIRMPLYRRLEPNALLLEYRCVEFVEEYLYGHLRKEPLVKTWVGDTIKVDITRSVPEGDRLYDRFGR
jgi:hypothetical protein